MSAIAQMLFHHGARVTGSDSEQTPMTRYLESLGIRVDRGHHAANVRGAECVIFSSSIQKDNPEILEAERARIPLKHRAEALALLSHGQWVAAVSGTHGKTTTTALLGRIYQENGQNPTVVVGAKVPSLGGNVSLGSGDEMILEADESDASFLAYEPNAILITNIDRDHLDHFEGIDAIYATFKQFVSRLKPGGRWVGCGECPHVQKLLKEMPQGAVSYGLSPGCDYRAGDIEERGPEGSAFELYGPDGLVGKIHLKLIGLHNVLNAVGAAALALEEGVRFEAIQRALAGFEGASRRFEVKCHTDDFTLVDDYAHHPTEIHMTLRAARGFTGRKVIAVFQPHRYTRIQKLEEEFAGAFDLADEVVVTDIYAAGETPLAGISGACLSETIRRQQGSKVRFVPRDQLLEDLLRCETQGTLWIMMGAGDISQVADQWKEVYEKKLV